jgi:hypothetical protein
MNKKIAYTSLVLLVLFCWIVYPYKWIKKSVFNHRKGKAIRKAKYLNMRWGRTFYVVQNGMNFFVGDRTYFRRKKIKWNKRLRNLGVETDYRKAIIFTANERITNS